MFRIPRIILPQELNSIREFGHASRDVVIAVETDCAICYGFRGLGIGTRNCHTQRGEPFLELAEEPRTGREASYEPDGL